MVKRWLPVLFALLLPAGGDLVRSHRKCQAVEEPASVRCSHVVVSPYEIYCAKHVKQFRRSS